MNFQTIPAPACACPLCGSAVPASDIILLANRGIVRRGARQAHITPMQARILSALLEAQPRPVSRSFLVSCIYTMAQDERPGVLEVQVCRLRRLLAPLGITILTEYGGYSLPYRGRTMALPATGDI